MGFLLKFVPVEYQWLAKLIAGAVLLLAMWYAWHQFTGHYIDIGKAKMQPRIDELEADKNTLQNAYADLGTAATKCSDSVRALELASDKKKAASVAALAAVEIRASSAAQQAQWLAEQLAKPEAKGKTCGDALKEWRARS